MKHSASTDHSSRTEPLASDPLILSRPQPNVRSLDDRGIHRFRPGPAASTRRQSTVIAGRATSFLAEPSATVALVGKQLRPVVWLRLLLWCTSSTDVVD
jgi:hypothetical protein